MPPRPPVGTNEVPGGHQGGGRNDRPTVAIRCDASMSGGVGHVMRSIALAEGLIAIGLEVIFLGDMHGVALAAEQLLSRGLALHPAPTTASALLDQLSRLHIQAMVVDSYTVSPDLYSAVRSSGRPVVAIVDSPCPTLDADLLVNQNLGAETAMARPHRGRVLAGVPYALLRSSVSSLRPDRPPPASVGPLRVLVMLGGTDVRAAAATAARRVLECGLPVSVDVVCASSSMRDQVRALPTGPNQQVRALAPLADVASVAVEADIVLTATGTTVWELACLGRPMALVTVADNQLPGYRQIVENGLGLGLGPVENLERRPETVRQQLSGLLSSQDRRSALARASYHLVDGRGRDRVAAQVSSLLEHRLAFICDPKESS